MDVKGVCGDWVLFQCTECHVAGYKEIPLGEVMSFGVVGGGEDPLRHAKTRATSPAGRGRHEEGEESRYVLCCNGCGQAYGARGWCDVLVPDAVWATICPEGGDGGGLLCFNCIACRCEHYGFDDVPFAVKSGPMRTSPDDPLGYRFNGEIWTTGRRGQASERDGGLGDNDSWVGPSVEDAEVFAHGRSGRVPTHGVTESWRTKVPRCLGCERTMRMQSIEHREDGIDITYRCDGCLSEYKNRVQSDIDRSARDAMRVADPAVVDVLSLLLVSLGGTEGGENRALLEESRAVGNAAIALCDALGVEQRGSVSDRLVRCVAAIKGREAAAAGAMEPGQMRVGRGARVRIEDPMSDRVFAGRVVDSALFLDEIEEVDVEAERKAVERAVVDSMFEGGELVPGPVAMPATLSLPMADKALAELVRTLTAMAGTVNLSESLRQRRTGEGKEGE